MDFPGGSFIPPEWTKWVVDHILDLGLGYDIDEEALANILKLGLLSLETAGETLKFASIEAPFLKGAGALDVELEG